MTKKKKEVELKEVSRTEVNGTIIIKYEDGSIKIIPAPIALTAEEAEDLFGSESDEEDEDEEDEEDEEEEDEKKMKMKKMKKRKRKKKRKKKRKRKKRKMKRKI
jgi:hypothetical protein